MTCPFKERPGYRSVAVIGPKNHVSAFFSNLEDAKKWVSESPFQLVFVREDTIAAKDAEIASLRTQLTTANRASEEHASNAARLRVRLEASKDAESASIHARLNASVYREASLLRRVDEKSGELAVCRACLSNRDDTVSRQDKELTAIHAAHRAAVQHWSDSEALNRVLRKEVEVLREQLSEKDKTIQGHAKNLGDAETGRAKLRLDMERAERAYFGEVTSHERTRQVLAAQVTEQNRLSNELSSLTEKHNALLASGYTDQSAEIQRLKMRVNDLILRLDQIHNQTNHFSRETV